METYRHRQLGTVILGSVGSAVLLAVILRFALPVPGPVVDIVLVLLVAAMFLFHSLLVVVTPQEITASFGPGLIRRRVPISDIRGVRVVRNAWYYGWGIRLLPHGWLLNVSGLDGVEIDRRDRPRLVIGTDDPQGLLAAIEEARGLAG